MSESNNYSAKIKVILLGESRVGKTCLINAYFGRQFRANTLFTTIPESENKIIEINEKKYLIELFDTAGQEKYRSMNNIFIKGSKVVIFVYDVTEEKTFIELDYWIKTTKEILAKDAIYGIAGNKADLVEEIKIPNEKGKKYAEENGAKFCETSAKEDSKGFQSFLNKLIQEYIETNIDKISNEKNGKKLSSKNNKKKKKCC